MGLRDYMNRHTNSVAIVAVIMLIVAVSGIWLRASRSSTPRTGHSLAYFFDLDTHELFADSSSQIPPIREGKAVRAFVFSCGSCDEKDARFIGWLEKFSDQAKQALESGRDATGSSTKPGWQVAQLIDSGRAIAAAPAGGANDVAWLPYHSPQANQLTQAVQTRCNGQPASACAPSAK